MMVMSWAAPDRRPSRDVLIERFEITGAAEARI